MFSSKSFIVSGIMYSSLIQFSVDGWGCVPSLLSDLRSNYGGYNEDNENLLCSSLVICQLLHLLLFSPNLKAVFSPCL